MLGVGCWMFRSVAFPLTPTLSPEEREPRWPRYEPAGAHDMRKPGLASPSPWGEGRGEGELCSRRFHGASSSVQVTLQTRGQFLAALDKNVRAPVTRANHVGKMRDAHVPPQPPPCVPKAWKPGVAPRAAGNHRQPLPDEEPERDAGADAAGVESVERPGCDGVASARGAGAGVGGE